MKSFLKLEIWNRAKISTEKMQRNNKNVVFKKCSFVFDLFHEIINIRNVIYVQIKSDEEPFSIKWEKLQPE